MVFLRRADTKAYRKSEDHKGISVADSILTPQALPTNMKHSCARPQLASSCQRCPELAHNSGYLIERLLCKDPDIEYNDLAQWHYADLPKALGCDDWFTGRVTTCGEFDQALRAASEADRGAYIEVVTDKYAAPLLALKFHESVNTLYRT